MSDEYTLVTRFQRGELSAEGYARERERLGYARPPIYVRAVRLGNGRLVDTATPKPWSDQGWTGSHSAGGSKPGPSFRQALDATIRETTANLERDVLKLEGRLERAERVMSGFKKALISWLIWGYDNDTKNAVERALRGAYKPRFEPRPPAGERQRASVGLPPDGSA